MPTTDPKAIIQASGTTSQPSSQDDEFDLGITQELPQEWNSSSFLENSETLEPASQEESQTFDFSLDLPETYAEAENSSPVSELSQASAPMQPEVQDSSLSNSEIETAMENPLDEGLTSVSVSEDQLSEEGSLEGTHSVEQNLSNDAELLAEEPLSEEIHSFEENLPSEDTDLGFTTDQENLDLQDNNSDQKSQSAFKSMDGELSQIELPQVEIPIQQEEQPAALQIQEAAVNQSEEKPLEEPKKALNLDEMMAHFSNNGDQNNAQSEMDPFSAMKATLEAQKWENQVQTSQQTKSIENVTPLTENMETAQFLEEKNSQAVSREVPQPVVEASSLQQSPEVQNSQPFEVGYSQPLSESVNQISQATNSQTLDLDALTSMPIASVPTNPLTAPVAYPQQGIPQTSSNKRWTFAVLASVVAVVALGVMAYIRYPDIFSLSFLTGTGTTTGVIAQNPSEEVHWSAPELLLTGDEAQLTGEYLSGEDAEIQPVEVQEITGDFSDEEWSWDIQTIDLRQGEEEGLSSEIATWVESQQGNTTWESYPSKDPLSAVESVVGPINNNDVLKQEIADYLRRGTEFKEAGVAQNKKTMMKYGLAVEKEAQKILDDLANGGNIDISTWSSLKTKLDDYLVKASNA